MSVYDQAPHLCDYFFNARTERTWTRGSLQMVGMEVETSFVDALGCPVSLETSEKLLRRMRDHYGWSRWEGKYAYAVRSVQNATGDRLQHDLGRQNIELSAAPRPMHCVVKEVRLLLEQLYEAGMAVGAYPRFAPIVETTEDLLAIPDERDQTWLMIDGREALAPLACTSSVQFTLEVPRESAIPCLNRLGASVESFLKDYPQDAIWRTYIGQSKAGYSVDRYGGPLTFDSIQRYCLYLSRHDVVTPEGLKGHYLPDLSYRLKTHEEVTLFVRSVWWYFRLRRYGEQLCIEVRPLARREDACFGAQLAFVLETMNL